MNRHELLKRTRDFAHRSVKLSIALPKNVLGKYLADQIIRSAISVAANYRAACIAQSKKEFISKLSIALEEADETEFWISFIEDENLIENDRLTNLKQESKEITSILAASRLTAIRNVKIKK